MKKDIILKKIDYARDYFNRLWNSLMFTITGTLAVSFNLDSDYKRILLFAGIFFSIICLKGCKSNNEIISKYFKELEKEEEK